MVKRTTLRGMTAEIIFQGLYVMNPAENDPPDSSHESGGSPHESGTTPHESGRSPHESKNNHKEDSLKNPKKRGNPEEVWGAVWKILPTKIDSTLVRMWDNGTTPLSWEGDTLLVGTFNSKCLEFLQTRQALIETTLRKIEPEAKICFELINL